MLQNDSFYIYVKNWLQVSLSDFSDCRLNMDVLVFTHSPVTQCTADVQYVMFCCDQWIVQLRLRMTSVAAMNLRAVMGRVFHCLSAVTGLSITVLTAPMSSTAVR